MSKSKHSITIVLLCVLLTSTLLPSIHKTKAQESNFITIRANGEIYPETAPIQKEGSTYILTSDILNKAITIEKNNITIDGAGYHIKATTNIKEYSKAIEISQTSNITIKNLTISGFTNKYGSGTAIQISNSQNTKVERCMLANNSEAISIIDSEKTKITKNIITDFLSTGIIIRSSKNISITNNTIAANKDARRPHGIYLSTDNALISKNHISNCIYGIEISGCFNTTLHRNYFTENQVGIYIIYGGENLVTENIVLESESFGIILSSRERNPGNIVYHNNFINNNRKYNSDQLQVSNPWFFGPEDNIWDNGEKGNYWSDYKVRYPQAKEVNQSGYYDTVFYINPENIDTYPLVDPLPFSIAAPTPTPSSTPAPEPEFPTTIVASIATIAVIGIGILAYFKKYKRKS